MPNSNANNRRSPRAPKPRDFYYQQTLLPRRVLEFSFDETRGLNQPGSIGYKDSDHIEDNAKMFEGDDLFHEHLKPKGWSWKQRGVFVAPGISKELEIENHNMFHSYQAIFEQYERDGNTMHRILARCGCGDSDGDDGDDSGDDDCDDTSVREGCDAEEKHRFKAHEDKQKRKKSKKRDASHSDNDSISQNKRKEPKKECTNRRVGAKNQTIKKESQAAPNHNIEEARSTEETIRATTNYLAAVSPSHEEAHLKRNVEHRQRHTDELAATKTQDDDANSTDCNHADRQLVASRIHIKPENNAQELEIVDLSNDSDSSANVVSLGDRLDRLEKAALKRAVRSNISRKSFTRRIRLLESILMGEEDQGDLLSRATVLEEALGLPPVSSF